MGEAIFVDGVPARITAQDFLRYHLQQFPKLANEQNRGIIDGAIEDVYAMFHGVQSLWDRMDKQVWYDKTVACYRLLTAWYIADMYPKYLSGVPAMGGVKLKERRIGPVSIKFADDTTTNNSNYLDLLSSLKSNPFGGKAYLMIRTAGKKNLIGKK